MKRMKTYDVPHKGLRNGLAQLQLLAGKTDYSNSKEVEELYNFGQDVFKILTIHAHDEDEVTLSALEKRCPGAADHDFEGHAYIHQCQDKLEQLLTTIYTNSQSGKDIEVEGEEFYLAFSEFHGAYLEHTAAEERMTQPLLWENFTDEELAAHRGEIMAKNPPETLLIWFRFVIPAQSFRERVGLLTSFKKMAPESFFLDGMQTIRQVLTAHEWMELNAVLGNME